MQTGSWDDLRQESEPPFVSFGAFLFLNAAIRPHLEERSSRSVPGTLLECRTRNFLVG